MLLLQSQTSMSADTITPDDDVVDMLKNARVVC